MNSLRGWNALSLGFVISLGLASSFVPQGCGGGDGPPVAATLPGADGGTVATSKYTLSLTLDDAGLKVDAIDPYEEMRQTAHASGPWDPDALLWYIEGADGTTLAGGMIEDPRIGHMMDHEEGATTQVGGRTNSATFKLDVPVNTGTIKIYQLASSGMREGGCNPGGLPLGSSGLGGVGGSESVEAGSIPIGVNQIVRTIAA